MIVYQLKCHRGHEFEAWFLNGSTYDSQQASGDVCCPVCGTTEVSKGMMAPNLSPNFSSGRFSSRKGGGRSEVRAKQVAERILEAVDDLREHVEENCDYVGDEFAEEAKRIHSGDGDGDGEERGIYGEATDEEAEDLDEEGIEYFRLPFLRRRDS